MGGWSIQAQAMTTFLPRDFLCSTPFLSTVRTVEAAASSQIESHRTSPEVGPKDVLRCVRLGSYVSEWVVRSSGVASQQRPRGLDARCLATLPVRLEMDGLRCMPRICVALLNGCMGDVPPFA